MGSHSLKVTKLQSPSRTWYGLALFAEYSLIATVWVLGLAVLVGARTFSVIPFSLTLVTTVAIAYAATRLRGTLRELVLDEDRTSGTGRKSSNAPTRHRTASA